jgi:apolipoprotein N-acyltransferase
VLDAAPQFTTTAVTQTVRGYSGATPYVRTGNTAALAICIVLIGTSAWVSRRARSATG